MIAAQTPAPIADGARPMAALDAWFGPGLFTWGDLIIRLGAAIVLAGLIGLDRERMERAAGLKTHMLVSVAAAAFAVTAMEMVTQPIFRNEQVQLDTVRIVEAVTAGVAFLAAGAIFRAGDRVRNLTTGAGLWVAGGIGLACGLALWRLAIVLTCAALLVMVVVRRFERSGEGSESGTPPPGASFSAGEGGDHSRRT